MNKFVLIAIILASISGVGVLGHNMFPITLQSLQVFSSIDEFTDPICSCQGTDGTFSPENCNQFAGDYQDPNGLCTGIASTTEYGQAPKVLSAQGCGVGFWKNNVAANPSIASIESGGASVWPPGYQPDYYYADMFQTTLVKPQSVIAENEEVLDEINEQEEENEIHTNDVIVEDESNEEITEDENNETKDDGEKVNEETGEEYEDNEIHSNDVIVEDESKEDVTGLQIIPPADEEKSKDENDKEKEDKAKGEDNEDKSKEKNEKEKQDVVKSSKGPTLLEALELKGGKENALMRQSVAAMLNAAHSDINYPYTVSEIIALTQIALSSENYEKIIIALEENNENLEKPQLCFEN